MIKLCLDQELLSLRYNVVYALEQNLQTETLGHMSAFYLVKDTIELDIYTAHKLTSPASTQIPYLSVVRLKLFQIYTS